MVRETRHLWVGNLPHTICEERILDHFKRYGKVQSVKILPKKEEESSCCATVAFIDIKSAAKAHGADNKIDERTLKTDYYEPISASSSTSIYIHERDVRPPQTLPPQPCYPAGRTPRYGLPEDRNYERPGHYYAEREPYLRRPLGIGYHDEDNYQGRAKSRDRYSRSTSGNNYTEGNERNQNHFRAHNARQHFEQQRYPPINDQYNDERESGNTTPRLNRRTNNNSATPIVASVASPSTTRSESRPRRTKRRSLSRTPSISRSNSGSRSRSSSGSRSSSSSSKLRSSSSDSSGRSRSPSKSRSPAASSYGSQSNAKGSRLERPTSAIANPSNSTCYLPSTVNTSAINCTANSTQSSTPSQNSIQPTVENNTDKEEKRPLGICVRNLPARSTDTSLKDGLFHEYKKHGKVTMVKVIGQGAERYAVVCFKKPEDVDKALEVSKDKHFFGCKIEVTAHEGLDADDNEFRPLEAELDEFHPKATRTLFIGNLEKDITTQELRKHFEQFGEIIEIDIKKQGSATSYAFIQYADIASVVKAMRKLDGENLGANRIKLGFGKSMPTNCVWLDGIVDTVSEKFLARHFSRFGIVAYTAVDREKGHALVFYESVEFAQIAVSEMRGRILGGKKLQVDFASRECQTTFFDKLEMTGQMIPGDGTRPWERRERRPPEFEVIRSDDREARVGFENRVYPRYENQPRPARGNFRGGQRTAFNARGRGQGFSPRYEVYHDEFGERRHRYNSREESGSENAFDVKLDRPKYSEPLDCPNRKRNKLRNSISDQESHHSQSPPRSRHQSRSTSPVSKDRKSLKDRLHHRIKSPGSHNSSVVNSPCRDTVSDEMEVSAEFRDFRPKNSDGKYDDISDVTFPNSSPRNNLEKDAPEKAQPKIECDSFRTRSSLDSESADEANVLNDQLGQLERKKRLLASASNHKGGKDINLVSKILGDKAKLKTPSGHTNVLKPVKVNCISESMNEDVKKEENMKEECNKEKPHQNESANTDLKYLKKKQVHILQLLEQLHEGINSSDTESSLDGDKHARKKHNSLSACLENSTFPENDSGKSLTKDDSNAKLKCGIKESALFAKMKNKTDGLDGNNCIALSLDSFILRKHLDPRKGFDQHSVSLASTMNALQKYRRISLDNDTCLPNSQGTNESFLCVPSSLASDIAWKKHCGSLSDIRFTENIGDDTISLSHFKTKDDNLLDDEILTKKSFATNSSLPIDLPKSYISLRNFPDSFPSHEIKRERDISPLSLPLPKFAASLRSPKSSPSIVTSPKNASVHSPRAGHSPSSYSASKSMRLPELSHDIQNDKKSKDISEDKVNGANLSSLVAISPFESQATIEAYDPTPCLEQIQSPKSNNERNKESNSSSESEFSPSSSPNRPSIEDRIKALDEKFNAWSGSARAPTNTMTESIVPPTTVIDVPKAPVKRSRFNFLTPEIRSEPSEIVKSLLAKSTIFDQDSKRLQHIDEKYEPLNIKMDLSPKVKPAFRTKAAAKEFSIPIAPPLQNFNQNIHSKSSSILVAQGIMSPPATPQNSSNSILSPVTPVQQYSQLSQLYTPCSPRPNAFNLPCNPLKNVDDMSSPIEKEISDPVLKAPQQIFNLIKPKTETNFIANSTLVQNSLKLNSLTSPLEISNHNLIINSPPNIKKEVISPDNLISNLKIEKDIKVSIKKEPNATQISNIPLKKDCTVSLGKDQIHFNSFELDKKERCDIKDPRLASHHEGSSHWRETNCKDAKINLDSSAKQVNSIPLSEKLESTPIPAVKKRVSSIDSNESESSKSIKSSESNKDTHEIKHESISEPEAKKPKLSKNSRDRSLSPPHSSSKKIEKKEKSSKIEKSNKSSSKTITNTQSEKEHESKNNVKNDSKNKSEHKNKEDKKSSKLRDTKDNSKSEQRTKSKERQNSEKENKNTNLHNSKSKKESTSKNEKNDKPKNDKKQNKKSSSSKSKTNKYDFQAYVEEEPVYFSMYDKVKARSSKTQTLKHQAKDLETMRQKFSKLKQSRAKREEKSKSLDQESEKDSDSCSHHSSESDSQSKSKIKQQRKRKLVIESSSDDDVTTRDTISRTTKSEKEFSESATDSDFDYNVSQRQSSNNNQTKNRRKKSELLDSETSDSDCTFTSKFNGTKKKTAQHRSKARLEKSKKIIKSDDDLSDEEIQNKVQIKEHKSKKLKKEKQHELKIEQDNSESELSKKSFDDNKNIKKKSSKELKSENETSSQKKQKTEKENPPIKEKSTPTKDKRTDNIEKMHIDDNDKHKPYSKKRKKSKKVSRNKEKKTSDKMSQESRKMQDESDTKSSLPILLSPKPSSPIHDKQLSPPCLQAGILSDNDFKSDFSDFEFESHHTDDVDLNSDIWKQLDTKSDINSDKSSKTKKKETTMLSKSHSSDAGLSPDQDSSLPSLFDKLSDITDSETGRDQSECPVDTSNEEKKHCSSSKKEKDVSTSTPRKKHEKLEDQSITKQETTKFCDNYSNSSKEEKRKKKSKKQCKEKKKKIKEESSAKDTSLDVQPILSPKTLFDSLPCREDDTRLSDIRLDEEIAEEARRLEQELLDASEETSTFGDEGPARREEKLLERRFEEEAAKETRRLEAELFSTGRESWHMKEKGYDPETHSDEICDDKHINELDTLTSKEDNLFAVLDLHSSIAETSQNEADVFLSGHSESDQYKLEDKDTNDMEDQRKIEDDLAVSALLQEMHCGEISAPELTKETDFLEPLMESHPEDTMNYLLPDDSENSLHIADESPEMISTESQENKLESPVMLLSPSSNSEPPALEISNMEDSVLIKDENANQIVHSENPKIQPINENEQISEHVYSTNYDFSSENNFDTCESKPPIIDIPNGNENVEQTKELLSPKHVKKVNKKQQQNKIFKTPTKSDGQSNDDTEDESTSELADNQLSHFEDITMDNADSKDDDNPPVLQPVESPRNLLPVPEIKEKVEPVLKSDIDDENCLDAIIGAKPQTSNDSIFDKVSDLDKQIGEIINSITELKKQTMEVDPFRTPDSHEKKLLPLNISDLSDQNSNDSLVSTTSILNDSLQNNSTKYLDTTSVLNSLTKSINSIETKDYNENPNSNKFMLPENNFQEIEPPLLNYTEIIQKLSCETSVIKSPIKSDYENAATTVEEKHDNLLNMPQTSESIAESCITPSLTTSTANNETNDNFLLDLFGPLKEDNNIPSINNPEKTENNEEFNNIPEPKNESFTNETQSSENNQENNLTPLFNIPDVNEQNEATEFNQEIFEPASDQSKDHKLPRLLSFSSEHLFSNSTENHQSLPKETSSETSEMAQNTKTFPEHEPMAEKLDNNPLSLFSEDVNNVACDIKSTEPEKESIDDTFQNSKEIETIEIEDSLDSKSRPVDVESVCSDTTDITIPDTKIENELPLTSIEDQIHEESSGIEIIEINPKPKTERPRRGRRPRTRKYSEPVSQKPETSLHDVPLTSTHSRNSSRRLRPTSSERRRSLRSNTVEPLLTPKELNGSKENLHSENELKSKPSKRDEDNKEILSNNNVHIENDCSIISNTQFDSEIKNVEKLQPIKTEEPRKRRGRKKKSSGDHQNSITSNAEKSENKDDSELTKDFTRPKESRLWLSHSSEKEQKTLKDTPNAYDVFEFRESEDEDLTFENVKEKLHENVRTTAVNQEIKHETKHETKLPEIVTEKDKKPEEIKQKSSNDERDATLKEHNNEVNQHPKISITIRLLQKDGHDGLSPGTAEVVKTSEALNIEDIKPESTKVEKASKQDVPVAEVPYNGPCKSTRKSTRLMNQAARSTVDEVIEEVVKGNFKTNHSSHNDSIPTRVTRRSRSTRRSEETIISIASENSEDATEDKNKNEPVFFILDNTVKDVTDNKKSSTHSNETTMSNESNTLETDKITDRIASLRSFRIRSTANKLESNKDIMIISTSESDSQKKDNSSNNIDEKSDIASHKESVKDSKMSSQDIINCRPPLPVLKVELPRMILPNSKELFNKQEKSTVNEEENDSRSSPAALIDPVTGFLTPVNETYPEGYRPPTNEAKTSNSVFVSDLSAISTSVINMKSSSKTISVHETPPVNTVIQENVKNPSTVNENVHVVRAPLVQNSKSKHSPNSSQTPVSNPNTITPPISEKPSKTSTIDKNENIKPPSKKATPNNSIGVLTIANTLVSNTPAITSHDSASLACTTSSVNVQNSKVVQSNISISGPGVVTSSNASVSLPLLNIKSDNLLVPASTKVNHSSHGFQTSVRTIVTSLTSTTSSSVHTTNVQNKCSSTTVTSPIASIKNEVPEVCIASSISPSSHITHTSNANSKPVLNVPVTCDHSTVNLGKYDMHPSTTVSTTLSVSWPNAKTSSRIVTSDVHSHVSTIQSHSTNSPIVSAKSESRTSKMAHAHSGKSISAFTQQPAFPVTGYETSVLSSAHNLANASNTSGGVIAELLQNPQLLQQHKEYLAVAAQSGQLQDRIQSQMVRPTTPVASGIPPDIAARLGNPTPPHTPTPPVTSSNHSLQTSDIHSAHSGSGLHIRHPTQPPLIVPPHPIGLHPSELNAYVHQQIIYAATHPHYAAAIHSDIRAQQEAQARAAAAIGMNPRFAYPSIPPASVNTNNFRQPSEPRHQSSPAIDAKSDQKSLGELAKIIHETRNAEEKVHQMKSMRIKKEDKDSKMMHSECRDEHENTRHIPLHDKIPSTSASTPHNLRQTHSHYSSTIRQLSPRLTVSPHERITDSPVVANLYTGSQGRVPQISIAGQVDDHKDNNLASQQSHHYKNDTSEREIKPPVAHQTQPSTIPYHTLEAAVHPSSRQQMHVIPPIGAASTGHDGRTSNPAHSPGTHNYKKDTSHSQQINSAHVPSTDKRNSQDHSKKVVHARTLSHQGSSISPGPVGLGPPQSPLPWPSNMQSHNSHHSITSSQHALLTSNEQSNRRANAHHAPQMGSDVTVHAPPPAHAMSQPMSIPRTLPQTPPHASQVPPHGDAFILQRYPVMWQGLLALKNDQAAVQMHFVTGNPVIARASLPPMVEGETAPVRIAQRMRLEPTQLEGVTRKMLMGDEHCILMALPCGKDHMDVLQQSSNLKNGFINYLQTKQAAGIVNAAPPGSQQPAYVIHIFPSCEFSDGNLARIAPDLLHIVCDIAHLVIIIATV